MANFDHYPRENACSSGATLERGRRVRMMSFGAISVVSSMVLSVVVRVIGRFSCKVYVKSGRIHLNPFGHLKFFCHTVSVLARWPLTKS